MALKKQLEDVHFDLNKSYDKLEYHKETLNQQAERVKEQIINNITMQIDAFNQRKNWLVNQLELVKCEKMESIQREQDAVKCSMLKVKKILNDQNKFTNLLIKEELEKINNNLGEETRPFLGFRSDSVMLREIISQYGVIIKQYSGHFADPTRPSISLPRVVEEEDDEDNLSYTRKYETQNKIDQNVLHITKHSANPSVVRAWLMTTNENGINNIENDSESFKSEQDSFVRKDSSDSIDTKKSKDEFIIQNENKDLWFLSHDNCTKISHLNDNIKPIITKKMQNINPWLLESNDFDDDEKEIDHCDFVKKVCKGGNCKTFYECSELENCCHNLINPHKPFWNKWLIDNNIVNRELLNDTVAVQNIFTSKFSQVLKSENEKWLDKKVYKEHFDLIDDRLGKSSQLLITNKKLQVDYNTNNAVFNLSLNKWITLNHQQKSVKNKDTIIDLVDKSLEKVSLDDIDGLFNNNCKNENLGIDCNRWMAC